MIYPIGIIGRAGHGKDTLAGVLVQLLAERLPIPVKTRAFAAPLKEHIGEGLFRLRWTQVHGAEKEDIDPYWKLTPRQILQRAGTECFRHVFGGDFWVRVEERSLPLGEGVAIYTDVRYENEALWIKKRLGYLFRIVRRGHFNPSAGHHSSETSMDDDYGESIISNDGTIEDLRRSAGTFLPELLGRIHSFYRWGSEERKA